MDGTAEDAAEDDPEEGCRAEHYAHDCAEDRAKAGDVEELDEEDFPCRHCDVVNTVSLFDGRSDAFCVDSEETFDHPAVKDVAQNKEDKSK